jgi:hypothetical protein
MGYNVQKNTKADLVRAKKAETLGANQSKPFF